MATVTGVTAQRANEIEDKIIVQAAKQGRSLVFTTDGGSVISIPNAFPAPYESWPVGSYLYTDKAENPATYMGGGTWQRKAQGRVLVGLDENDADFDTPAKTGGYKTHTLTVSEMPNHAHGGKTQQETQTHTHGASTGDAGGHSHQYSVPTETRSPVGGGSVGVWASTYGVANTTSAGNHSHTVAVGANTSKHDHVINPEGGGAAHNNVQPYWTVYIWQRTA